MELSFDELEHRINEICSGQRIIQVDNIDNKVSPLLLKYPSLEEREISTYYYNKAFKEAESMGIPTMAQMEEIASKRALFSARDQEELESLESKLKGQQAILAKTTRVPARRERLKGVIAELENKIYRLRQKKESCFDNTCERKATEEKLLYLCWVSTYSLESKALFWDSYRAFEDESDIFFRRKVFTEFVIFYHGYGNECLRYIARSNLWRIRYSSALKTHNDLFGRPIKDYTSDQLMLSYWSNYYQSIYEMLSDERPPDSIIEDDASLDAYMRDWQAEKNRESASARGKNNNKYGSPSAWDHEETYVMKSNDMHTDIEYSKTLKELKKDGKSGSVDAAPMTRNSRKKGRFS